MLVGRLLHLLFVAPLVVLAHGAVLLELLQEVDAVAADVADGDARLLGIFVRDLDHLLAALLVHLGDAEPDHLTLGQRVEAEVRIPDRLLDRVHHASVPDLNAEQPRLGHADGRDLADRHHRPVSLDLDRVEEVRRGAAGTQAPEIVLQRVDGALHATLHIAQIEGRDGHSVCPRTPETRLPGTTAGLESRAACAAILPGRTYARPDGASRGNEGRGGAALEDAGDRA